MSLHVYNTLSRKREKFEPINAPLVKMYCCGPTVYDLLHVGNFRGVIFYNFVRNWLEEIGYKVTMVYNYTDVDDKIINRATLENIPAEEVAKKYIGEFEKDFNRLKLRAHDLNPKVTDSMDEIKAMIAELIEKQKAYIAGSDVNYSIRAFPDYGKLSGRNPDDLLKAVRIERDEKKKDPLDFALWKAAKPGEPAWESPWGAGRPGWHIECSAMIRKHLGDSIDIHGGGMDLLFPHHENEIAQSEGCSGKHFVKYWIHNNMINFGGAKMSKSVGNIRSARDFMDEFGPEILKYMMLSVQYRSTLDLGPEAMDHAIAGLARIYSALAMAESILLDAKDVKPVSGSFRKTLDEAWTKATEAFNEDFNTAEGIAKLFEVVRQFNGKVRRGIKITPEIVGICSELTEFVSRYGRLMALFAEPPAEFLRSLDDRLLERKGLKREKIDQLVAERGQARLAKDFAKSDELRKALTDKGISVSDLANGSYWEVTK